MNYMKIANSCNFFEIHKPNVIFWGLDIAPKSISLTKKVLDLAEKLNLPLDEVVEIYDDKTSRFFKEIYLWRFRQKRRI